MTTTVLEKPASTWRGLPCIIRLNSNISLICTEPVSHRASQQVIKFRSRQASLAEMQHTGDNRLLSSTCHNGSPVKCVSTVANADRWRRILASGEGPRSFYCLADRGFSLQGIPSLCAPTTKEHDFYGGILPGSTISLKGQQESNTTKR